MYEHSSDDVAQSFVGKITLTAIAVSRVAMAAMAVSQTVAARAFLGSSRFSSGQQLKGACSNGARVTCKAALTIPKGREALLAEAEKRWEAAQESPLAGVSFSHDEFADALSKYDFSFEVGDMVRINSCSHFLPSIGEACQANSNALGYALIEYCMSKGGAK